MQQTLKQILLNANQFGRKGVNSLHAACVFLWFSLLLNVPVNSYCHVGTISSPNHTFFLGKWLISNLQWGEWSLKLFHDQPPRKYGTSPGSNLRSLYLLSDLYLLPDTLPTVLRGPVFFCFPLLSTSLDPDQGPTDMFPNCLQMLSALFKNHRLYGKGWIINVLYSYETVCDR